ncbi:molybdopterin converting factor subunit 1 [uncultured Pseudoteredinibacter sp.]|uniref:molybdopterin converting factor subunit 1 n=1 Tax=uncultured Pseudoteredinibacter sp. TaxID=1641701 RepID=UPI002607B911|nr:molybdopterin converting factor subunit 1 [uncultured Pseudoteredinibacter sp.]
MITLLYFARYREVLGLDSEQLVFAKPCTVQDVIEQLKQRGEPWSSTLSDSKLMLAVNQTIASAEQELNDGDELAFFPPVTGG